MKHHKKILPLFDIDGTLMRAGNPLHHKAFNITFKRIFGFIPDSGETNIAGMLDRQIVIELLEYYGKEYLKDEAKFKRLFHEIWEYFVANGYDMRDQVLPGVRDVLSELKSLSIPAGLLTGNSEAIAWEKMKLSKLMPFLTKFGGFGDAPVDVRAELIPIAVERANRLTGNGYVKSDVVIIGDTPRDIECARLNGARVIAVATGSYSLDDLAPQKPDLLIENLEHVDRLVDFIGR